MEFIESTVSDLSFPCLLKSFSQSFIQSEIESIIRRYIDGYGYGTRREDQTQIINESGLFGDIFYVEGNVTHSQSIDECVEAWRSHATLQRQAGESFSAIISSIETMLLNCRGVLHALRNLGSW